MKLYKISLAIVLGLGALTSCDSKLDVDNPNQQTTDIFGKEVSDLEESVIACYNHIRMEGTYARVGYMLDVCRGDEVWNSSQVWYLPFDDLNVAFTDEIGQWPWRDWYYTIKVCNYITDQIVKREYEETETIKRIKGQALFLRGLSYYMLAGYYQNPMLITDYSVYESLTGMYVPNSTYDEVWDQVEKDFAEAMTLLPSRDAGGQWAQGRATSGAAAGYYARDMAPNDSYQTFNTWLLFGDPSAIIRTAAPAEMNVTVSPSVLMLGMTEAQISVDADYAIATLSMDGEILASARVENGQCNMTFPALSNVGNAELVILGFNKATYMGEIEVVPAEGAFITVNDYVLLNAEQANYGETVDLDINVKNVGVEVANNLTGTLTTECPYVEILSDQATIAEISPDEIVTLEGFQFSVAEDVPDGTVAQFFLNVSDGTNEWEGKFNIVLHAPVVAFDFIDNDGEMLEFHFSNYGSAPFYGGTFNIYSSSADLIFAEDEIIFNDTVNGLESITLEMPYSFADGVEPGTTFEVAYEIASGLQLVTGEYILSYGAIMDDFETGTFGDDWTLSAQYPWTIANEGRNGYCAKSANAGINSSEGYCELTVAVLAAGNLTFWYKVSSEQNYDKLHFYMDGQDLQQWSGTVNWTQFSQPVTPGVHTFRWSYSKDYSVNSGSDCAWIDDIQFPPVSMMTFINPVSNLNADLTGMTVNLTWEATPDVESFLIKRNDEVIATVTETNFSEYVNEGIYKYSVFAKIGDQISRPESVMVQVMYDGAEETQEANFSVYPNPTKGVLNINAGNSNFEYSLFNGMGQEVAKGTAQGSQQLHVSDMAKGVYFLRLTSGNQVSIQKVVVE